MKKSKFFLVFFLISFHAFFSSFGLSDSAISDIAMGLNHVCVLKNSKIICWGKNQAGQLNAPKLLGHVSDLVSGYETTCVRTQLGYRCWGGSLAKQTETALSVVVSTDQVQLALGWDIGCAVINGSAKCWGGIGPGWTDPPQNLGKISTLSVGASHICAIQWSGTIKCWGTGVSGQLDSPSFSGPILEISAGYDYSCARSLEETKCWGKDVFGYLNVPKALPLASGLKTMYGHSCILIENGHVRCWGDFADAQTGPVALSGVKKVVVGESASCALLEDRVECWGKSNLLTSVPQGLMGIKKIITPGSGSCALTTKGVQCWGVFSAVTTEEVTDLVGGQFGYCYTTREVSDAGLTDHLTCVDGFGNIKTPVQETGLVKDIALGANHGCVLLEKSGVRGLRLKCWGANYYGQADTPDHLDGLSQISAGTNHTCGLFGAHVKCWGTNFVSSIEPPSDLIAPSFIASSNEYNCAIDLGKVRCWGEDTYGLTKPPEDLLNPKSLTLGKTVACTLTDQGVRCWGSNMFGLNTIPLQVNTQSVVQISTGDSHVCALMRSDKVICWGENFEGQTHVPDMAVND